MFHKIIANKLNALILAMVFIPLLLMSGFAYVIGKSTLEDNLQKTLRVASAEVTFLLDEFMVSRGTELLLIARGYQLQAKMQPATTKNILESQLALSQHFSWLGYLDATGALLGDTGRFIGDRPVSEALLANLYQQAGSGSRLVDADDQAGDPQSKYVIFIQPVTDLSNRLSGYLLAQLPMSDVVGISNRIQIGETGRATLFNHKGILIGHPVASRYGYDMSHYPVMIDPVQHNRGNPGAEFVSGDGRAKYGITTLLPRLQKDYGVKWGVITDQTLQELYQPIYYLVKVLALLAAVTLVVVNVVGLRVGRKTITQSVLERESLFELQSIAAVAFETKEAILITDVHERIIQVNRAFTTITGYSAEEVVGKTPRLLQSGKQDKAFYQTMWQELQTRGYWEGEVWNRRKNGEIYPERATITAIRDAQGVLTHYLANFSDITLHKQNEERIHQLAFYDPLTQLANRRMLQDRLQQALASSVRTANYDALLFIDLDHFKTLNDTLGHDAGDILLKQVAERLNHCVREGDTVARPGGDEFIVLLEDLNTEVNEAASQAEVVAEKIRQVLCQPYDIGDDKNYVLSASIGVSLFGKQGETVDELMKHSDLAMYHAKTSGRNTVRFFDPVMQEAVNSRSKLERDLRRALREGQFELFYQPKVDLRGVVQGYEALIRWCHPERGLVSPMEFIPAAEENGLILELGHWVLEAACTRLAAWAKNPDTAHLNLAVNVSARQLHQDDFVASTKQLLDKTGANPASLGMELTESLLMENVEDTVAKMVALKNLGVTFSLDDFGTGYSSLSYLKNLPITWLKIDQSFVRDMLTDPNAAAIVHAVVALSMTLGLKVIAEGVETAEQHQFLAEINCDELQGYLFGKPAPLTG